MRGSFGFALGEEFGEEAPGLLLFSGSAGADGIVGDGVPGVGTVEGGIVEGGTLGASPAGLLEDFLRRSFRRSGCLGDGGSSAVPACGSDPGCLALFDDEGGVPSASLFRKSRKEFTDFGGAGASGSVPDDCSGKESSGRSAFGVC